MKEYKGKPRTVCLVILLVYIFVIVYVTCIDRAKTITYQINWTPFWSYAASIRGNSRLGKEIFENILLFCPLGFIFGAVFRKLTSTRTLFIVGGGMLVSSIVEMLQLVTKRGLCEFDDLFNNTLGTFLGVLCVLVLNWIMQKTSIKETTRSACYCISSLALVLCGILVCIAIEPERPDIASLKRDFVFHIDDAVIEENSTFDGHCFILDQSAKRTTYKLSWGSTESETMVPIDTTCGIIRNDVNNYYRCRYDYSASGFEASFKKYLLEENQEYELFVKFSGYDPISTDTFYRNGEIYHAPYTVRNSLNLENTDLDGLKTEATLLGYSTSESCYVYQYDDKLYMLASPKFDYAKEGRTYIEYHVYTTQIDRLPEDRQSFGYDELDFIFEENEITNTCDCGNYRVAVVDMPKGYSITAILMGQYRQGEWIWKTSFRPVIKLGS